MKGDAIDAGVTTNMDTISKDHSARRLAAHGLAVGLNDGLMGNSEVGYVYALLSASLHDARAHIAYLLHIVT